MSKMIRKSVIKECFQFIKKVKFCVMYYDKFNDKKKEVYRIDLSIINKTYIKA